MASRPADHARDPAWLLKLWLDIHGGDPAPHLRPDALKVIAADIIKATAKHLDPAKQRAVIAALG